MKNFLIAGAASLIFLLTSMDVSAKTYYCKQTDTTPWGCRDKNETYNEDQDTYVLRCEGAGETMCQFSDGTCPDLVSQSEVEGSIRERVRAGEMTGKVNFEGGFYTWNAIDLNNFDYTIVER